MEPEGYIQRFISRLSDQDLRRIVKELPPEYSKDEVELVKEEITKRNLSTSPSEESFHGSKLKSARWLTKIIFIVTPTIILAAIFFLFIQKREIDPNGSEPILNHSTIDTNIIREALENDDSEKIGKYIQQGFKVNHRFAGDETPLNLACSYGSPNSVKFLLKKGADIEARNINQMTPLMSASEKGWVKIGEILVANHADINAQNNLGQSALMIAILSNQSRIVRMLLDQGADPTLSETQTGKTALDLAHDQRNGTVAFLVKKSLKRQHALSTGISESHTLFQLDCESNEFFFVAMDEDAIRIMFESMNAVEVADVMTSGRVFKVDCDSKVIVLHRWLKYAKVKFIDGDHLGMNGWVHTNFLKESTP